MSQFPRCPRRGAGPGHDMGCKSTGLMASLLLGGSLKSRVRVVCCVLVPGTGWGKGGETALGHRLWNRVGSSLFGVSASVTIDRSSLIPRSLTRLRPGGEPEENTVPGSKLVNCLETKHNGRGGQGQRLVDTQSWAKGHGLCPFSGRGFQRSWQGADIRLVKVRRVQAHSVLDGVWILCCQGRQGWAKTISLARYH